MTGPIILKAVNGAEVKLVAIYTTTPKGLSFSPHPESPLIGSNTLQKGMTSWSNIDASSLSGYPQLERAYRDATSSENPITTTLNIGPHFNDLKGIRKEIEDVVPLVTFRTSSGQTYTVKLTKFIASKDRYRAQRVYITDIRKNQLVKNWTEIHDRLKPMNYRPDVIHLRTDLKKAIKAVESLNPNSKTFDKSIAEDLEELLGST
jgi:translation initiation factor 2 beta subunit (eIF-2beta)/eIF-5